VQGRAVAIGISENRLDVSATYPPIINECLPPGYNLEERRQPEVPGQGLPASLLPPRLD
jgi:hypothetical protein